MMSLNHNALFLSALHWVLHNEGGFVYDPLDSGGATNSGITQRTLAHWRGRPVSVTDVQNLSQDEIAEIYFVNYWRPLGCPQIVQIAVATAMFDAGVLFGVGLSALYAQRALRSCGYSGVATDRYIGPRSVEALNTVTPALFIQEFRHQLRERILEIVNDHPKNERFQAGWEKRADRLLLLVSNLT